VFLQNDERIKALVLVMIEYVCKEEGLAKSARQPLCG